MAKLLDLNKKEMNFGTTSSAFNHAPKVFQRIARKNGCIGKESNKLSHLSEWNGGLVIVMYCLREI